jgi:hypothetical protein
VFLAGLAGHLLEVADAGGFHFRLLDAHRNGDFTTFSMRGFQNPSLMVTWEKLTGSSFWVAGWASSAGDNGRPAESKRAKKRLFIIRGSVVGCGK